MKSAAEPSFRPGLGIRGSPEMKVPSRGEEDRRQWDLISGRMVTSASAIFTALNDGIHQRQTSFFGSMAQYCRIHEGEAHAADNHDLRT